MDIISHTLTGIAVGTVFAAISKGNYRSKGTILLAGGAGGALPDFDAISLWSKFDPTIGAFFGLEHSGKEIYFSKFWYSHHAAFHSILAPVVLMLLAVVVTSFIRRKGGLKEMRRMLVRRKYAFLAFFFGFLFHLLEDMPTPASVWGGVNLFFPGDTYIGGFGDIWWWNNYDLVLIIVGVIFLNLLVNIAPKHYHRTKVRASIAVFIIGLSAFVFQIRTRPIDFSYSGHTSNYEKFESQSKLIQKEILGEKLFELMVLIDNKIPLNF